jgi:ribonuclease PH
MDRIDNRTNDQIRPVTITPSFQEFADGSVLIESGKTRVICSVSVDDKVPPFLKNSGRGWVTAEYSMLPRATLVRTPRDITKGSINGRSQEIQRLIGRSLRSVVDMNALGERTLQIDCDVIQADGGTRTASITGSYVAVYQALYNMVSMGVFNEIPIKDKLAAISVGVLKDEVLCDLCYEEDSTADCDFNVVMQGSGKFVELQGTAEGNPYSREILNKIIDTADKAIRELFEIQQKAIDSFTK